MDRLWIAVSESSRQLAMTELKYSDKASDTLKMLQGMKSGRTAVLCKNDAL